MKKLMITAMIMSLSFVSNANANICKDMLGFAEKELALAFVKSAWPRLVDKNIDYLKDHLEAMRHLEANKHQIPPNIYNDLYNSVVNNVKSINEPNTIKTKNVDKNTTAYLCHVRVRLNPDVAPMFAYAWSNEGDSAEHITTESQKLASIFINHDNDMEYIYEVEREQIAKNVTNNTVSVHKFYLNTADLTPQ